MKMEEFRTSRSSQLANYKVNLLRLEVPMAVRNLEYVELYVSEAESAVDYFVSAMGFRQVARSAGTGQSSVLLRQGTVQLAVTTGSATHDFLDRHGDGVVDIAMTCDDVAETQTKALAAGASLISGGPDAVVVSGWGVARHTLLPATPGGGTRLPPARSWEGVPPRARAREPIRCLDHVAICVPGDALADCADFCETAFGMPEYSGEYVDLVDQAMDSTVVRSPAGGATFTLVAPDPEKGSGQLDAFLSRNGGPGVQHLAFGVDDVVGTVAQFRDSGVDFLRMPGEYYDALGERFGALREVIPGLRDTHVLADCDEWGYLLQLFTRSPYERNTLFYELIQRHGARGFGSANIRALYEAVDRERMVAE
jgi:4-hydroxymandelate synthase